MSLALIGLAVFSGILAAMLVVFTIFFDDKVKEKSTALLVWSALFLLAMLAVTEYTLWTQGIDFFKMTYGSLPLLVFFGVVLGFYIWIFEKRGQRKIWMIILGILGLIMAFASVCMDCL